MGMEDCGEEMNDNNGIIKQPKKGASARGV